MNETTKKFYVVAVDMGYGHQRAAFPFTDSASGGVINANNYDGVMTWERDSWQKQRRLYEFISYFKRVPLLGRAAFTIMDKLQAIAPFYPQRDLSATTAQQQFFWRRIKRGLLKNLIERLNSAPLPLLTTFFVPVYAAEYYHYRGSVYCVICDADIARPWAPLKPAVSRVIYLVPTRRAGQRLQLYGVKEKNIILTGFPLPKENIGGEEKTILKQDLAKRLARLDPSGAWRAKHLAMAQSELGELPKNNKQPITLTFAVGGAGAQREMAGALIKKFKKELIAGRMKINLVAGTHTDVWHYFLEQAHHEHLAKNRHLQIIHRPDKDSYFRIFNRLLRTTDILITKPSELSFYAGLGLPLLLTPPVGAQEWANRRWLLSIGAAFDAVPFTYINEWLPEWLANGQLARAAWRGYQEAESLGTYNIEKIINRNLN